MLQCIDESALKKILQCYACYEIPFPPIRQCSNGHIACNACREQMKQCGVCRERLLNARSSRNLVMEQIVEGCKFACNYKDKGCQSICLGSDIKNHLETCTFRPRELIQWVQCSNGQIPEGAFEAGYESTGEKIYVARASHTGGTIPGRYTAKTSTVSIPWGGSEREKNEYEILVAAPDSLIWVPGSNGEVGPLAVKGGPAEHTGEMLYIGRWNVTGTDMTVGKIHPTHRCCYVPFEGQELCSRTYEVLTTRVLL